MSTAVGLNAVGTVIETDGAKAKVAFKRQKACGDCHACASFGADEAVTEVENTLGAKVGDRVNIALHQGSMLKAVLIMYGIPLLMLVIGVFVGSRFSDLAGALLGIAGALGAFLILRLLEPRFAKKGEFAPKMTAFAPEDGAEDEREDA